MLTSYIIRCHDITTPTQTHGVTMPDHLCTTSNPSPDSYSGILVIRYADGSTITTHYQLDLPQLFVAYVDTLHDSLPDILEIRFTQTMVTNHFEYPFVYIYPRDCIQHFFRWVNYLAERTDEDPFRDALLPFLMYPDWFPKP
jgi:hypothetical protein